MNKLDFLKTKPQHFDIIPEFNRDGRLCNYHTGEGIAVRVMAAEWERFNAMAGRQHEIIDGIVYYNENLEPCMPDNFDEPDILTELAHLVIQHEYLLTLMELGVNTNVAI